MRAADVDVGTSSRRSRTQRRGCGQRTGGAADGGVGRAVGVGCAHVLRQREA